MMVEGILLIMLPIPILIQLHHPIFNFIPQQRMQRQPIPKQTSFLHLLNCYPSERICQILLKLLLRHPHRDLIAAPPRQIVQNVGCGVDDLRRGVFEGRGQLGADEVDSGVKGWVLQQDLLAGGGQLEELVEQVGASAFALVYEVAEAGLVVCELSGDHSRFWDRVYNYEQSFRDQYGKQCYFPQMTILFTEQITFITPLTNLLQNKMQIALPVLSPPATFVTIQPDTFFPMTDLVYTALESDASEFLNRHLAQLGGMFVYSFTLQQCGQVWKIFKRHSDFVAFSQTISTSGLTPPVLLTPESPQTAQTVYNEMLVLLRKWSKNLSIMALFGTFIECSGFDYHGLIKYKEVMLSKRNGGRENESCKCCMKSFNRCRKWKPRLFIVHSQGVLYKDQNNMVQDYLQYDWDFLVMTGPHQTDWQLGITLYSVHRKLYLQAYNPFDFVMFIYAVKQALKNSEYAVMHRYDAFFPVRQHCTADFYVDGDKYFFDVAHTMLAARQQILITDWMLSPQFYLIRPVTPLTQQYRLDRVLYSAACRGVKIHIILYQQATMLNNNSKYASQTLQKLHSNIKVIRHPQTVLPFMWSHHEKMVVVDERVAFAGGLDLTYSRYDDPTHPLFDYQGNMFPGIEYTNQRKQEVKDVEQFEKEHLKRDIPRMPWHDIALRLRGMVVNDLVSHFIRYWNYSSSKIKIKGRHVVASRQTIRGKASQRVYQATYYVRDLFSRCCQKIFPSQNLPTTNRYVQELENNHQPEQSLDSSFRLFNRKPKHHAQYEKKLRARFKAADDFERGLDPRFIKLLLKLAAFNNTRRDKFNEDFISFGQKSSWSQMMSENPVQMFIRKNSQDFWEKADTSGKMTCQLVRSCSSWSIGREPLSTEYSVQIAYIDMIGKAKRYIFIENQFFMSSTADEKAIHNQIGNALIERIVMAAQRRQPFKVYVFMPLLPSFAGQIGDQKAAVMRLNLHWQLMTISQSQTSIVQQLSRRIGNWKDYIQFLGLRNHGRLTPTSIPVTQIIYIHSKLMIVDDEKVIVGSANINDRSLNGGRDSEIAFVVRDNEQVQVMLDNTAVTVNKAAYTLRCKLFHQHYGIKQAVDPVSQRTWALTQAIAAENTLIYRTLFGCYPDDNMLNFKDIQTIKGLANISRYNELTPKIRGHAVQFPIRFLSGQKLNARGLQKQNMMPKSTTT